MVTAICEWETSAEEREICAEKLIGAGAVGKANGIWMTVIDVVGSVTGV